MGDGLRLAGGETDRAGRRSSGDEDWGAGEIEVEMAGLCPSWGLWWCDRCE